MKLVRKINNNFALAEDSNGNSVIVMGKGIGFCHMPSVVKNLGSISRTFYGVDKKYIDLIDQLPDEVIDIASKIVKYVEIGIKKKLNPNLVFVLADHINFAIKRYKAGVAFRMKLTHAVSYLYEQEMMIGIKAINYINKKFSVSLPKDEASIIALHIVEAELISKFDNDSSKLYEHIIQKIVKIIEFDLSIKVIKNDFTYSRFISHLQYLFKRIGDFKKIDSNNQKLFQIMKEEYSEIYQCSLNISKLISDKLSWKLSDEELFYLMLHINRLVEK